MRREWTVWLGFTAVVLVAVLFVVSRDDKDDSKLSAGTSVPTTVGAPTTVTTRPPTSSTSSTSSPSTTTPSTTAPPTTRSAPATNPGTVATTEPPATVPATAPATTAPPATDPPLGVSFGVGTYRVNIDLPAGTYRTNGVGPYCYWARLSTVTANPTPADVIASASTGGGPATVSILPSDAAFATSGCDIWLSV